MEHIILINQQSTKYMRAFILFYFLCCACIVYGQRYISVKEMISNYNEKRHIDNLKNYDFIYNSEESPEAGLIMEHSLLPSDLANKKGIRAEWSLEYFSSHKEMLYLKNIYFTQKEKEKEALIYKRKLAEKYGISSLGIPAVWYSGKITVLSCPRNLFGEVVTKYMREFFIKDGQVVSYKSLSNIIKKGSMESARSPRPGVKYSPIATTDGCWYNSLIYKLDLLEEFVNSTLMKHNTSITKFDLDLLLVTDKQGKTTGYVLSPERITNKEEQVLSTQLTKRISELPLWSFGWLWTINGSILQGRYLKAKYLSDTGWKFEDYLY